MEKIKQESLEMFMLKRKILRNLKKWMRMKIL